MPEVKETKTSKAAPSPEMNKTPEETPAPAEVVVKEKSRAGLIAIIIVLAFLLGGAATLLVLQFNGTIQLQNLFNGGSIFTGGKSETNQNSYGGTGYGMYGGTTDDSANPTPASAQSVCENAGNVWKTADIADVASGDEEFSAVISEAYTCMLSEGAEPTEESFVFRIAFTTTHFTNVKYYQEMIEVNTDEFYRNGGGVFENSENFFKGYEPSSPSSNGMSQYGFMALYKNAAIELFVATTDTANRVLSQIGFPDRSYKIIGPQTSSNSGQSSNTKEKKQLTPKEIDELEYYNNQYAASGLVDYLWDHDNTYPDIAGLEGTIIDGTGTTALDDFYRKYISESDYMGVDQEYTDANGDPVKIRFYSSAHPEAIDEPIVTIHLETSCYGDNFDLMDKPGYFAVTYPMADGGFRCDPRGRGEYHF